MLNPDDLRFAIGVTLVIAAIIQAICLICTIIKDSKAARRQQNPESDKTAEPPENLEPQAKQTEPFYLIFGFHPNEGVSPTERQLVYDILTIRANKLNPAVNKWADLKRKSEATPKHEESAACLKAQEKVEELQAEFDEAYAAAQRFAEELGLDLAPHWQDYINDQQFPDEGVWPSLPESGEITSTAIPKQRVSQQADGI